MTTTTLNIKKRKTELVRETWLQFGAGCGSPMEPEYTEEQKRVDAWILEHGDDDRGDDAEVNQMEFYSSDEEVVYEFEEPRCVLEPRAIWGKRPPKLFLWGTSLEELRESHASRDRYVFDHELCC